MQVFIDDRVDMYPARVSRDYRTLLAARPGALQVLDRHRVDVVLWDREYPLTALLEQTDHWRQVFSDDDWLVFRRCHPEPSAPEMPEGRAPEGSPFCG